MAHEAALCFGTMLQWFLEINIQLVYIRLLLGAASVPLCRACHYLITIQDQRTAHCPRADEMHNSCMTLCIQSKVGLILTSLLHGFLILSFQIKFGKFEVSCVNVWHIFTHQFSVHSYLHSFESYLVLYGVMSWTFSL